MTISQYKTSTLLAFSAPTLVIQLIGFPILMVLPTFYAAHTAVSLASVGAILGTTRLVDALVDPVIGMLSDRTQTRWGRRKPWLVAASILGMIGIPFLFSPPVTAGIAYFLSWTLLVNFAWGCFNVPHSAWASELTRDYRERSRVFYFKGLMGAIGTLAFLAVQLLPEFHGRGIGREALSAIAWIGTVLLPVALLTCIWVVPTGARIEVQRIEWRALLWSFRHNRPLWIFLGMYCMGGIGTGIALALTYLYIQHYLHIGASYALIVGSWALMNLLGMPIWLRIVYRLGKPRTLAVSWGLAALVGVPMWFVEPGPGAAIPLALIFALRGMLSAAEMVVPSALFGDVVDYDILRSGRNMSGALYAFMGLLVKGCVAAGSAFGFLAIDAFGYSVAEGAVVSTNAELALKLTYIVAPMLLYLFASALIWRFPIGPREQGIIRRRIEKRHLRTGDASVSEPIKA